MSAKRNKTGEELTAKQQRFVEEYLVDLNATQAAIRAGYSEKGAESQGSSLLIIPKVSREIAKRIAARSKRVEVTQDYVVSGIVECAERCMQRKPVMEWDRENRCSVQAEDENGNGVWTFDSSAALKAFELLGKHLGMFTENKQKVQDKDVRYTVKLIPDD